MGFFVNILCLYVFGKIEVENEKKSCFFSSELTSIQKYFIII